MVAVPLAVPEGGGRVKGGGSLGALSTWFLRARRAIRRGGAEGFQVPIYDSACRPPAALEELIQIWRYRDLVVQLVRRDVVTRYKRSVLGVAWTMLNPLGTMLVLTIAFSQLFKRTPAYPAYLLTGLIAWNFFAQTTLAAMRQLLWGGSLLHRIYVPKTVFAVSAVGTGLVNLSLALIPLLAVMLVLGVSLRPAIFFLPISVLLLASFALGLGLLLSALTAYFADAAEMYEIILTAWLYLTPVIYPEEIIPPSYRWWLFNLNPMYHLIKVVRLPLYHGTWPGYLTLATAVAVSLVALIVGWLVFARRADEFAYRI
ncbi:MAG: ABC transporter permease [Anaerolineae bacterium]|nr:ABC transporter permease [Anaerolineae bacterium]